MTGRLFKNIRSALTPAIFFIPFTYYFFLFAVAMALAQLWLASRELIPGSSFTDIFELLLRAALWFLVVIIALGLISVLVSFIIFVWEKKRKTIQFSINTTGTTSTENPIQKVHVSISPVLKPFLGFIKLRLQYDEKKFSDKFALAEVKQNKLISLNYEGDYHGISLK